MTRWIDFDTNKPPENVNYVLSLTQYCVNSPKEKISLYKAYYKDGNWFDSYTNEKIMICVEDGFHKVSVEYRELRPIVRV